MLTKNKDFEFQVIMVVTDFQSNQKKYKEPLI